MSCFFHLDRKLSSVIKIDVNPKCCQKRGPNFRSKFASMKVLKYEPVWTSYWIQVGHFVSRSLERPPSFRENLLKWSFCLAQECRDDWILSKIWLFEQYLVPRLYLGRNRKFWPPSSTVTGKHFFEKTFELLGVLLL